MFKFFKKITQNKRPNPANKNLKDFFKHSGNMVLRITQIVASAATCFAIIKMRNEKNQLCKRQAFPENGPHSDNYEKATKNSKVSAARIVKVFLQAIVALTTVAASVATCFTVWEMREERNQLYKPQMIFESSHYSDDYEITPWGVWDVRTLIVRLNDDEDNYPLLETTIYNIGSGAALEIEIQFILDNYKEYVEAIGYYYRDGSMTATDHEFIIDYDGNKFHDRIYIGDFITRKPFLRSGESINIVFPEVFRKLVYYLVCSTYGDIGWRPIVHLQISFLDLQGIRYRVDYELVIQMEVNRSEQGDKYFHIDYTIEQGYLTDKNNEEHEEYYS